MEKESLIQSNKEGGDDMSNQNEQKEEGIVEKLEQLDVIHAGRDAGLTKLEKQYYEDGANKHELRKEIAKAILLHTDLKKLKQDKKAEYNYSMNLCKWYLTFNIYEDSKDIRADVIIQEKENAQNQSIFKKDDFSIYIKDGKERDSFEVKKNLEKIDMLYPGNQYLELQKIEEEYEKSQNLFKRHTLRKRAAGQIIRSVNLRQFLGLNQKKQEILLRNWTLLFSVTDNTDKKEGFFVKGKISRNGVEDIENSSFEFIITPTTQTKQK